MKTYPFQDLFSNISLNISKLLVSALFLSTLFAGSISYVQVASAVPVTATGTTPSVCNQEVSNSTGVTAVRLSGGECVVEFKNTTAATTWTVPTGLSTVWVLVIAGGGGGGGDEGGGGGAGGYREYSTFSISGLNSIEVSVGAGGNGGNDNTTRGSNGENSYFASITSAGGGGGGTAANTDAGARNGAAGGSGGGGAGERQNTSGGAGNTPATSPVQGFNGGNRTTSNDVGAGGGGAAEAGDTDGSGNGGDGVASSITGTSVTRAGGGGGGLGNTTSNAITVAAEGGGGLGGGTNRVAGIGTANTGGGGGGGGSAGGNFNGAQGGSGIVIVRYTPDTTAPTYSSSSISSDGLNLTLTYSETLSATTAAPANFVVTVNSTETRTISSVSASGSSITLAFGSRIEAEQSIAVTYTDPTGGNDANAIQDLWGNDAATLSNQSITNTLNSTNDSAISLNGSSQYASSPDNSAFDITGTLTLAAWVKPATSSGNMTVAGKAGAYLLQTNGGFWRYCLQGTGTYACISTGVPVVVSEWQHVAFTRSANTVNFYLNGSLAFNTGGADNAGSGNINNSSSEFQVGRQLTQAYFNGLIDEVKIWNTARTQSQIQSDLKTYGGSLAVGLVAYYDFNELVGNRVLNRSSGGSSALDLISANSPTITSASIIESSTMQAYTVVTFSRTYLVAGGGWQAPNNVSNIQLLIVGGGGGAGFGYCGGGGGAGRVLLSNSIISLPSASWLNVIVGSGGIGGYRTTTESSWRTGLRGETSSVTVASQTYSASGGGAGGGTSADAPTVGIAAAGTVGGSGGGGTACGTVTAGGAADNSNIPGFLSYANAGATGSGSGGGGGGAGAAATNSNGGAGRTIWGFELAAGGGGWPGGLGGTPGGGGNSGTGTASKAAAGNPGTPNTGSGGGGGNDGGSGIVVIRYITNLPTILTQPLSDTTTAGIVETFTVTTSTAPAPLTKSVQWQFTTDTATGITGWANVSSGTGGNTDTFTTVSLTASMNKYRFRAIVTFSDTSTLSVQETSTVAILTINPAITITSDTSTITRKYADTQTVRTLVYSGGTTNTGAVGTSTSHTVRGAFGTQASGKIVLDTSTTTAVFIVDTGTVVGSYVETITVTDFKGATATYTQRVIVSAADTLTVQADTLTAITFGATLNPTVTVTGLKNGDTVASATFGSVSCANGGLCAIGDIGPGGGVVFYLITNMSDSQTAITGYTSGGIYLEAAPVGWGNGIAVAAGETTGTSYLDPVVNWCNTTGNTGATEVGIGQGGKNTRLGDIGCTSGAVQIATDLVLGGKNDWYLPSQNELEQMGLQKNLVGLIYGQTNCYGTTCYWSSSEVGGGSSSRALQVNVGTNVMGSNDKVLTASNQVMMRPIRAFSPITNNSETVTAGAPTAAGTYSLRPTAITLANSVDTNNYAAIVYRSSPVTINRAFENPRISMQQAKVAYDTGTSTQALTATSGVGTGATFYMIGAGSAAVCSISGSSVRITSEGVCNVSAFKQASTNYLADSATAVAITFTRFVERPLQVQLYPTMIPLNQGNALETTTVTSATLTISARTATGAGAFTITGTGFTNIELVTIGGAPLSGSNYTRVSETTLTLSGVSSFMGPLLIRLADGQESVLFQFNWS